MTIVNDRIDCDLHLFIVKWKQMARDYGEKDIYIHSFICDNETNEADIQHWRCRL